METVIVKNKWIKNDDKRSYSEEHGWTKEDTIYTYYPESENPYCFIYNYDWSILSMVLKEGHNQTDLAFSVTLKKAKEWILALYPDIKMEMEGKMNTEIVMYDELQGVKVGDYCHDARFDLGIGRVIAISGEKDKPQVIVMMCKDRHVSALNLNYFLLSWKIGKE